MAKTLLQLALALALVVLPALAQQPQPSPAAPSATSGYTPQTYVSIGAGALVPGSGKFGYEAISLYLGQKTYSTVANEFTITHDRQVQECALAGLTKIQYEMGQASIGVTGLGGGCFGATNSGAAASVQAFVNYHLGHSHYSLVASTTKLITNTGSNAFKITFGVAFGQ